MINRAILLDVEETLFSNGKLYPDTLDFLDACQENGIKLVAFTDGSAKEAGEKLNFHKIKEYFDIVFSCPEYSAKKPNPKSVNIVRTLLRDEKAFRVSLENMTIIGDRPDTDICCGNRAKIQTIRVRRGNYSHKEPEYDDEKPEKEVKTLKEAAEVLKIKMEKKTYASRKKSAKQPLAKAGEKEEGKVHETDSSILFG